MRRLLWLAGVLAPVAGGAHAQSSVPVPAAAEPNNVSVADRYRPDYAPIVGRVGSFILYPRLEASAQYNSNLLAQSTNTISDVTFDVRPSIDLQSQWTRNRLDLNAYYDKTFHGQYSSENFSQFGGSATGTYDAGESTILTGSAFAARLTESRTDINSAFYNGTNGFSNASRSPIRYSNIGGSASVSRDFARLGLTAGGSYTKQSFDDATAYDGTPLPQGFRDNHYLDAYVEGRYLVGAGTRLVARGEVGTISYDQNPFNGFDRNSRNYRIEGGVALDITRVLHGELRAGYFRQDNFDPRFLDSSGISFSANLLWNPTALTSVRLVGDRSIEPGGSTVTSGNVRSTVAVTVDHELLPNLVLTGYGRYSRIEPQGPISDANEYEERVGAAYYLSRRFRFTLAADHFSRRSLSFGSFDQTTATLGVGVTL